MDKKRETQISKTLSWLLRHGGIGEGIKFRTDGFCRVQDVLDNQNFAGVTVRDLTQVVNGNDKHRFCMKDGWVKATQGHSMVFPDLGLKKIESVDEIPCAIHGTYKQHLSSIMKEGLNRMNRTHIHFSIGEPEDEGVISGMRTNCQVLIYLDIQKCLDDGIGLYLSENNVVLTSGTDGVLETKYFAKVVDRKTRAELY